MVATVDTHNQREHVNIMPLTFTKTERSQLVTIAGGFESIENAARFFFFLFVNCIVP